jgi:hypothetical protein
MPKPSGPVLHQAVVEIRYRRGMGYFDRCGSLIHQLEEKLGAPFEGVVVPTVEHAEVRSAAERLVVQYGPKQMSVTQAWVLTPARVEHIAPLAWEQLSSVLGVVDHVTRCGVRFVMVWPADSIEAAHEQINGAALFNPSTALKDAMGDDQFVLTWSLVARDKAKGRMRIGIDAMHMQIEGSLPQDLVDLVPPHAIGLDVDCVYPNDTENGAYSLHKGALKDFIRASWQRSRAAASSIGRQLGVTDEPRKHDHH